MACVAEPLQPHPANPPDSLLLDDPRRTPPTVPRPRPGDLGSSRTRWFPWSPLFLNPHIAWFMKSNPVTRGCFRGFRGESGVFHAFRYCSRNAAADNSPRERS